MPASLRTRSEKVAVEEADDPALVFVGAGLETAARVACLRDEPVLLRLTRPLEIEVVESLRAGRDLPR